jgi:hypothetical protein
MFEKLGRAFKEAYENFKEELDRDAVPETVNQLLRQMHDEAADVRADIKRLEAEIAKALKASDDRKTEAATYRRREKMARDIGDEETARVAGEYAEKSEHHCDILGRKALAMKDELDLRRGEFEEMLEAIKSARANTSTLAAKVGRSQARDSLSGADDLFAKMDQLEEDMSDADHLRDAEREVDGAMGSESEFHVRFDGNAPRRDREAEAEDKLERLKRLMGQEDA